MSTRFLGSAALAAALTLAGGTPLQAADMPMPASAQAPVEVQRFVHALILANPQVQASRAALETGAAQRDAAAQPLYNPELELGIERSADDARTLGISQTLDWAGKRSARSAVGEQALLLASARWRLSVWALGNELLNGLARHQTAVAREALAARSEATMTELSALAERRFRAGDLDQVELSLARLTMTDARIQHATRRGETVAARERLRALAVDSPSSAWPVLTVPPLADALEITHEAALRSLPEVQAAERQVDLNEAEVTVRRRERRADPTLSVHAGEQAGESLVGLGISVPLLVRNRFDHEVRAALGARDEARFGADAVWRQAQARLDSADERYALLRNAWAEWEGTGQSSLAMQDEQLHRLWQAGELGTTPYLIQLQQTFELQDHALELRLALWEGWFEWLRASGRIDAWLALDTLTDGQPGAQR